MLSDSIRGGPRPEVGEILSDEDLTVLRAGYSNDRMNELARRAVSGWFAGAAPMHEWMTWMYFQGPDTAPPPTAPGSGAHAPTDAAQSVLSARDRELAIISMMTSECVEPIFLAIHIYWGLMEGLSATEIVWLQHLTGVYQGVDKFSRGVSILVETLNTIRECLPDTSVDAIVGALADTFR